MLIFLPKSLSLLDKAYEEFYKSLEEKKEGGLCYTRSFEATEVQAKLLLGMSEEGDKKGWISEIMGQQIIIWIVGGDEATVNLLVSKELDIYKNIKQAIYATTNKTEVENIIKLLTVEWKEKGHAFKT